MLSRICGFFGSSHFTEDILTPNDVANKTNQAKLDDMQYTIHSPRMFEDGTTYELMENPIYLNGSLAQVYDLTSLKQMFNPDNNNFIHPITNVISKKLWREDEPNSAFVQTPDKAIYTMHTELKSEIEYYVSHIEELNNQFLYLETVMCPIDDFDAADNHSTLFITTQKIERTQVIINQKKELMLCLDEFITHLTSLISNQRDLSPDFIKDELKDIIAGPSLLYRLLRAELVNLEKLPETSIDEIETKYQQAILKPEKGINYYKSIAFQPLTAELEATIKDRILKLNPVSLRIPVTTSIFNTHAGMPGFAASASQHNLSMLIAPKPESPTTLRHSKRCGANSKRFNKP